MEEVDQDLHIVNKYKSCCQINQLPVDIQLCVSHRTLDSFCDVKHCLLLIHDQQQKTTLIRLHCWFYGCRITLLQCMSRLNLPSVCSCLCGKNGKVCNQCKQGYKTCSILNSTSQNTHQGSRTWIQCYTLTSQSQFAAMKLCV